VEIQKVLGRNETDILKEYETDKRKTKLAACVTFYYDKWNFHF